MREEKLSPGKIGAEVLAQIANERMSGILIWTLGAKRNQILFEYGRAIALHKPSNELSTEREDVLEVLKEFIISVKGRYLFREQRPKERQHLEIDTFDEILVSMIKGFPEAQLEQFWVERASMEVSPGPRFKRVSQAIRESGGAEVQHFKASKMIGDMVIKFNPEQQKALCACLVLGAFEGGGAALSAGATALRLKSQQKSAEKKREAEEAKKPKRQFTAKEKALIKQIEDMHTSMQEQTHYQILGIGSDATDIMIREAYFRAARRWHTDRFAGLNLGDEIHEKVEDIFQTLSESHELLQDHEKRKEYDIIIERQAQGLPTDPADVLEAEAIFRRAQGMVRRGQVAPAEPLLRKAVELNRSDAEFWAYLGFCVYALKGQSGLREAREILVKSLKINKKCEAGYEFLGRVAASQKEYVDARKLLAKALDINPQNVDAQRELRLMSMREEKELSKNNPKKGLTGMFKSVLKR
ncbi:MAG: DnaJ domain-containing protein [Myxococcota bacterium]|jgi:tetratricopeptide (TPR) repeat protein|nr:DnaJ domain-containing protein [Myxococcota bacterium]